ncbi:MAG: hypothetical protein ACRDTE_16620 [Pseudonocardiaceae bacterium]
MSAVNEWLALMRVHEGGVAIRDGEYLNQGQPVADYLAAALDELIRTEHLALGRATPSGHQQVCVTRAGQARYAELNSNGVGSARHGGP